MLQLGLGEFLLKAATNLFSLIGIVVVIWLAQSYFRRCRKPDGIGTRGTVDRRRPGQHGACLERVNGLIGFRYSEASQPAYKHAGAGATRHHDLHRPTR